jgi:DNA-binding IscR family transcriptional regulator
LKHAIADVHERLRDVLRNVSLADLFRPARTPNEPTMLGLLVPTMPAEKQFAVN